MQAHLPTEGRPWPSPLALLYRAPAHHQLACQCTACRDSCAARCWLAWWCNVPHFNWLSLQQYSRPKQLQGAHFLHAPAAAARSVRWRRQAALLAMAGGQTAGFGCPLVYETPFPAVICVLQAEAAAAVPRITRGAVCCGGRAPSITVLVPQTGHRAVLETATPLFLFRGACTLLGLQARMRHYPHESHGDSQLLRRVG